MGSNRGQRSLEFSSLGLPRSGVPRKAPRPGQGNQDLEECGGAPRVAGRWGLVVGSLQVSFAVALGGRSHREGVDYEHGDGLGATMGMLGAETETEACIPSGY